ncbi:hypothetical protein LTR84_000390 [Exophiala bonariae]|uniref:Uncharacterized protein n=1 Tax=Exophiala bonariae TaxID=1690606 RepID=A0AAV9NQT4_9EURO|nr:hypothetical protein LTR84_000390 [Exophiala bonariae]
MATSFGGPIHIDSRPWLEVNRRRRDHGDRDHNRRHGVLDEPEKLTDHHQSDNDIYHDRLQRDHRSDPTQIIQSSASSGVKHASVFIGFSLPVIMLVVVINSPQLYNFHSEYWNSMFNHCNFNGVFTPLDNPSMSQWNPSGLFYITMTWGQMSFPIAKFIDVVWDNIAGRAVQAILAWITYRVSSQYLSLAMQDAPVSYSTYEALAFAPPTFIRTMGLARDLLTRRGALARLISVWIVLSSMFVISFSSWATAMTGYSSIYYAVMETYDGELVKWDNFQVVHFAIADAWRIGEPSQVLITTGRECVAQGFLPEDGEDDEGSVKDTTDDDGPWEYVPGNCSLFWRTVQYVNNYGLSAKKVLPSVFNMDDLQHNLSSPTLNITTSYPSSSLGILAGYLEDITNGKHTSKLHYVQDIQPSTFWTYRNETYSWDYMLDHTSCRYSEHHSWGFSFLILFITSLLLCIWSIGTYALWLYIQLYDQKQKSRHSQKTFGIYSASVDLAHALKNDFGNEEVQPAMRESDIRSLIRRRGEATLTGVQSPPTMNSANMQEAAKTLQSSGPYFEGNSHPMAPDNRYSKRPWNNIRSLLWPKPLALSHTLPYQTTSSSQAHIIHSSGAEPPFTKASSLSSTTNPSTNFDFSPTIPSPDAPGATSRTNAIAKGIRNSGRSWSPLPNNQVGEGVESTFFEFKRDLGDD